METPEEEAAELTLLFKQKGLSTEQASRAAAEILKRPRALSTPWSARSWASTPKTWAHPRGAAISSFVMFAVGAFIPLLPFLFLKGQVATASAAALGAIVLAAVGGFVGFLSGTSIVRSAARMVGLAALAAGVTYFVGRLIGASL